MSRPLPSSPALPERPRRVLHVLGQLRRGGVETWLMHVLRHLDRQRVQFDFVVHCTEPGPYEAEARQMGCRIFRCPQPRRPWSYRRAFLDVLRTAGPFDAVHSHVFFYSGYVLRLSREAGVPIRLAHGHTAPRGGRASLARRGYQRLARAWIDRYATGGLACSSLAAECLYGAAWRADPRWRVLPYGIDLAPFGQGEGGDRLRRELGLPPGALVVGHVGTFYEVKNQAFLVRLAAEILRRRPGAAFLLVGDGPQRPEIEQAVAQAGLRERFVFAGPRDDVPRLMRQAMDAFVFPSRFEGLGIVMVEAQAAGLPIVCSDAVPREAVVVPELVRSLSLTEPLSAWAEALLAQLDHPARPTPEAALRRVAESDFAIEKCVAELEKMYTR